MKMKQYAQLIIDIAKKYPDAEVLYSSDDEGNRFSTVVYAPSYDTFEMMNGEEVKGVCIN